MGKATQCGQVAAAEGQSADLWALCNYIIHSLIVRKTDLDRKQIRNVNKPLNRDRALVVARAKTVARIRVVELIRICTRLQVGWARGDGDQL